MFNLKNKVAVVTGASRGIGKEIAKIYAKAGAHVSCVSRNKDTLNNVVESIVSLGGTASMNAFDVSNFDEFQNNINDIISEYGAIDILVNNAGITKDNLLMRMSPSDFKDVVNVNLGSVFNLTKSSIKVFLKQKEGSIINISSIVGIKGNAGQSNYAASKAGIIGFSKSIALELGSRNIRCNVIAPGFIETDMTDSLSEDVLEKWKESIPLKRSGKPNDVGNACVFLASDLSSYITGQVLQVDGGLLT